MGTKQVISGPGRVGSGMKREVYVQPDGRVFERDDYGQMREVSRKYLQMRDDIALNMPGYPNDYQLMDLENRIGGFNVRERKYVRFILAECLGTFLFVFLMKGALAQVLIGRHLHGSMRDEKGKFN